MTEAKRTLGPWAYDSNHLVIYREGRRYQDAPEGYSVNDWNDVATLNTFFNYDTREYLRDRTEANARLIAAAPDLLAALEGVLNEVNRSGGLSFSTYKAARAVAAKAKGEA